MTYQALVSQASTTRLQVTEVALTERIQIINSSRRKGIFPMAAKIEKQTLIDSRSIVRDELNTRKS